MTSDYSSSDDENERFKEAIDPNFLKSNLYSKDESEKDIEPENKTLPSLRSQVHIKTQPINPLMIKVTPEFRNYVSKHLSKLLDESIDVEEVPVKIKKKKKNYDVGGVKLLKDSKNYLKVNDDDDVKRIEKKCRKKNDLGNCDFEERAKEVAVSGEWVLSQKETEHWAVINKGPVEVVKINKSSQNN